MSGAAADILLRAQEGILTTDEAGSIEWFNPAAEKLFGYRSAEIGGSDVRFLLPGISMVPAGGGAREVDGLRKDGTSFAAEVVVSELSDDRRGGLSVFVRDASERRRADESFAGERNFVSAVLDSAAAIVVILDTGGRVARFNRACEEISGYGSDDLQGRCVWDILAVPEERDAWRQSFEDAKRGVRPVKLESLLLCRSGERRRVSWSNAILPDKDGQPAFVISTGIDITEKIELEEQLLHAQKMEAVGRLASGVAHDFNNLITVISGFSELVLDSLLEDDPRRRDMEEIRKAGERAGCLTRQLLAFSRKHARQPQPLELNAVVRDVEAMLRRLMREDVDVRIELDPAPARIVADRGQMEQVLLNLAVNARDAMACGGRLVIRTASRVIESLPVAGLIAPLKPGRYVVLTVEDTGCGIEDAALPRVFEPFFTTKPLGAGTGLGLSTVYAIVSQSEGGIGVETAVGKGTSFHIFLPVSALGEEAAGAVAERSQRPARGAETVLLVEDDPDVRIVIARVLTRAGYTVHSASSGPRALNEAARCPDPIHLLVTDIVMPGMSGPDVHRELTQTRPGVRVLYISGHPQEHSVRELHVAPGAAFLQKPFPPDLLARRVREVLDAGDPTSAKPPAPDRNRP